MSAVEVLKGHVLLAEPFMMDPNFRRSAVVLCEHDDEGTVGFIMNKPLDIRIEDLISNFPDFETDLYYGGPVSTDTIHYMHNVGDMLDESIKVGRGVYWGGDFEKLKFLIDSRLIKPSNIRFFVGYSGWSPGQLDQELSAGSWMVSDMHSNFLFKSDALSLWERILSGMKDPYSVIAQMPDTATWN
ncbi:MAG: YqgE/AlgH family protein [Saprospiraceae bacterium]|nr:YqgE/AlgH family protein [Saprospiraceae bacterium]